MSAASRRGDDGMVGFEGFEGFEGYRLGTVVDT